MDMKIDNNKLAIASSFMALHVTRPTSGETLADSVIFNLHRKAFSYRPDVWRIRRNAAAYAFSCTGNQDIADRIHAMVNPVTAPYADKATKALKPKKQIRTHIVTDDEHQQITSYLEEIDDQVVLGAVVIARTIGVRPTEIVSLVFDDQNRTILVKGAKKRELGDRGIDRILLLNSDDYEIVKSSQCQVLAEYNRTDADPKRAMKRIQNRLYKQVRQIFDDRKSYPSLYSYRHQFGSDLKASGMDRVTIAAIMGHASVESVNVYGNRKHGGRKMNINVADESLDAVRNTKVTPAPSEPKKDAEQAAEEAELEQSPYPDMEKQLAERIETSAETTQKQPPERLFNEDQRITSDTDQRLFNGTKLTTF